MRFVFVDRIVAVEPGRSIETLRNVSATEDVFADHFPGFPILPGALIVETLGQAAELLIGMSHDWTRVGRLGRLARASFRHFVRPGDQLRVRCELRSSADPSVIAATADVDGRRVATAEVERVAGRLDILVSNAASGLLKDGLELSAKQWDWVLSTNARPLLLLAQEAAPLMPAGGRVVALSSLGSQRVIPGYVAIGVSRAALEALTRYLAVELGRQGITVNAVSAGAVETDVWHMIPDGAQALEAIRARTPGGRLVTPEAVADVVFFLASPAAQGIQGQVLTVDGGYSLLA